MKYFGYKDNIGYGFYNDFFTGAVSVSENQWEALLRDQSEGKEIVLYKGNVFASEPNRYYLDETGHYKKYTPEEILQLQEEQQTISATNIALSFLNDTDWMVTRHRDQLDMEIETSLTDDEYKNLLRERQYAREQVVHYEN